MLAMPSLVNPFAVAGLAVAMREFGSAKRNGTTPNVWYFVGGVWVAWICGAFVFLDAVVASVVWCVVLRWKGRSGKAPLETWIERSVEEVALEPEMVIIDPHHHFWDVETTQKFQLPFFVRWLFIYTDFNPLPSALKTTFGARTSMIPPYLAPNFDADIFGPSQKKSAAHHNVVATVCVESGWTDKTIPGAFTAFGEIDYALKEAKASKSGVLAKAVIPHLDLSLGGEIEPALEHLKSIGVTGIRDSLAWAGDELGVYYPMQLQYRGREKSFKEGFALLAKYGMSFDTWIYHCNLEVLTELARDFPEVVIVCDHVGGPLGVAPNTPEGVFLEWKKAIVTLAQYPNVRCKLSGLGMPTVGLDFHTRQTPPTSTDLASAWSPYITHCIDTFTPSRCMFASNFPVDKVSGSYTAFWNAFKIITKGYPQADRVLMFHKVAEKTYKLEGKI